MSILLGQDRQAENLKGETEALQRQQRSSQSNMRQEINENI